jgi:sugar-specific transcriptional regulator TrmB
MTEKRYYTARDIATILGIGLTKAYEVMHGFETKGQLFRSKKTMRVRVDYFDAWLQQQELESAKRLVKRDPKNKRLKYREMYVA